MSQAKPRQPVLPAADRTDVYLMQPRNKHSENMRTRLSSGKAINLQDGPVLVRPGIFHPQKGAVLVYNLYRHEDLEMVRQQVLDLARSSHGLYNSVVICGIKGDEKVRKVIEALPQTVHISGDIPGHDIDLVLMKMIRRWKEIAVVEAESKEAEPSPFLEVQAPEEKGRLLQDAIDSKATVVLSPYGSTYTVQGYFFAVDEARGRIKCQLTAHPQEILQCVKETDASKRLALSLSLKQSRVFFATTDFQWLKDSAIEIASPSLLYFVQRRKDFRHVVYPEGRHTLLAQVGLMKMACDIYDISTGGLSMVCTADELTQLKAATMIVGGSFQLEGETILIERMKLRHSRKFTGKGTSTLYRVGFIFDEIAPYTRETLAVFVNEKTQRYFQTYLIRK